MVSFSGPGSKLVSVHTLYTVYLQQYTFEHIKLFATDLQIYFLTKLKGFKQECPLEFWAIFENAKK